MDFRLRGFLESLGPDELQPENPDVRQRFASSGVQITGGPPQDFAAVLRRDYDRYGGALRAAGVKPAVAKCICARAMCWCNKAPITPG